MADNSHEHLDIHPGHPTGAFRFVPLFIFVVILYLLGKTVIHDPNFAIGWGTYKLSWAEVLLVISSAIALIEQMKVSHPGIDNTMEALGMIAMGVLQLILFVLGAANVGVFKIFANTEFLMLTLISLAAAVVAILINARTLRRTIGVGDN